MADTNQYDSYYLFIQASLITMQKYRRTQFTIFTLAEIFNDILRDGDIRQLAVAFGVLTISNMRNED